MNKLEGLSYTDLAALNQELQQQIKKYENAFAGTYFCDSETPTKMGRELSKIQEKQKLVQLRMREIEHGLFGDG